MGLTIAKSFSDGDSLRVKGSVLHRCQPQCGAGTSIVLRLCPDQTLEVSANAVSEQSAGGLVAEARMFRAGILFLDKYSCRTPSLSLPTRLRCELPRSAPFTAPRSTYGRSRPCRSDLPARVSLTTGARAEL